MNPFGSGSDLAPWNVAVWRQPSEKFGGPGRVRTVDLFHAMEARSQLRHRPLWFVATPRL